MLITKTERPKILIIDDNPSFVKMLKQVIARKGYEVLTAGSGQEGLRLLFEKRPQVVLLDVAMPQMDGWEVCRRIRDISDVPVVMLTGQRIDEHDIVTGLDHGADEYLIKPVGNNELIARLRAILRRTAAQNGNEIRNGVTYSDSYLTVDISQRIITTDGKRIKLTPREFRLFALLLRHANQIVTHHQLLENVWGWEYTDDVDYVRIYISHLRHKIEPDTANPQYIITEPGVGYFFRKVGGVK